MKQSKIIIFYFFLLISAATGCNQLTGVSNGDKKEIPPPVIDIEQEAALMPWTKIGGKLAYSRQINQNGNTYSLLFLADAGLKKTKLLTYSTALLQNYADLAWSFDGLSIAYSFWNVIDGRGTWELRSVTAGDGYDRFITKGAYPAWSRTGKFSYFSSKSLLDMAGNIIIDDDTTIYSAGQSRLAWSAGDSLLVFLHWGSNTQAALYTVAWREVSGGGRFSDSLCRPLLQGSGSWNDRIFNQPAISPDGKTVLFVDWGYRVQKNSEIWSINIDGSNERRLTTGNWDRSPVWSPDGTQIIFSRGKTIPQQLFLMTAEGKDTLQITANGGAYPAWTR